MAAQSIFGIFMCSYETVAAVLRSGDSRIHCCLLITFHERNCKREVRYLKGCFTVFIHCESDNGIKRVLPACRRRANG